MSIQLLGATRNQIARATSKYFNRELGVPIKAQEISPDIQAFADKVTSIAKDVDIFKRSGRMTDDGKEMIGLMLEQQNLSKKITLKEYLKKLYSRVIDTSDAPKQEINAEEVKLFA